MNPEKMRETYGKMVFLLQDANTEEMVEELGFNLVAPIKTVRLHVHVYRCIRACVHTCMCACVRRGLRLGVRLG